ncbi:MAG: LLM class F420-dependent oxidoreductase [Hyphomicrobiaceae bacterium]|nr:LLM class F420-dependent oxidoreductase [Hyphomicrobiaceae bacterium]
MKFGLRYCNTGAYVDPAKAVELAQAGEEAGFESIWTVEHTVVPGGYGSTYPYAAGGKMAGGKDDFDLPDPLIWMAYVAAVTRRIKLATGIMILPQHNPVVVAKQVATLDHMSKGRILLGIGVGWLKEEFAALGVPFDDRGRRTDEYMRALRELWGSEKPTFEGEFVRFKDAYCRPQPVAGHVPLIVGGHSPAAARRAGRLGDGFFPARGAPKDLFDIARAAARDAGRDPDKLEFTVSLPEKLEDIPALAALGVKRVLVPVTPMGGLSTVISTPDDARRWKDTVARYASM